MIRWIWFMLSWYTETAYKPYHSTQQKTLFQPQNSPLGDTHRMASITGIVHAIENDRLALFNRPIDGETKCVRYVTSHITSASLTLRNQISKNKSLSPFLNRIQPLPASRQSRMWYKFMKNCSTTTTTSISTRCMFHTRGGGLLNCNSQQFTGTQWPLSIMGLILLRWPKTKPLYFAMAFPKFVHSFWHSLPVKRAPTKLCGCRSFSTASGVSVLDFRVVCF